MRVFSCLIISLTIFKVGVSQVIAPRINTDVMAAIEMNSRNGSVSQIISPRTNTDDVLENIVKDLKDEEVDIQYQQFQSRNDAIDLDLFATDFELLTLKEKEALERIRRYEEDDYQDLESSLIGNSTVTAQKAYDYTVVKDLDDNSGFGDVSNYTLSKRDKFNDKMLRHILEINPRFLVYFADTKTHLGPDNKIMYGTKEETIAKMDRGEDLVFVEINLNETNQFYDRRLPATSCLLFPTGRGSGSVSFDYSNDITMNGYFKPKIEYPIFDFKYLYNITSYKLAVSYTMGFSASRSVSISGAHSCDTDDGDGVRLFYEPSVVEVKARTRNIIFTAIKNLIHREEWQELKNFRYMADSQPTFYCATSDKVDLNCSTTIGEKIYVNNSNVVYEQYSHTNSHEFTFNDE
ncbi:hypothetical protein DFJ63DRAFT_310584 [Scheffersomyces coipomensis]|uniref:uncharacterized protein n=1 Tax=Scheffersomyces coipomensis TaxID=1788519 RepID=UPI00315CB306